MSAMSDSRPATLRAAVDQFGSRPFAALPIVVCTPFAAASCPGAMRATDSAAQETFQ